MEQKKVALTVIEASEYTGIGRNRIRQLVSWKKIPSLRNGTKILIPKEAIDTFIKLNEGKNINNQFDTIAVP